MSSKKKFKYELVKKDNEINLYYNIRKLFIENNNPKNEKELKKYDNYSHILVNILFLKCRYSKKTEDIIKKFLKKHKSKLTMSIKLNL
jgi:hypothetical protein